MLRILWYLFFISYVTIPFPWARVWIGPKYVPLPVFIGSIIIGIWILNLIFNPKVEFKKTGFLFPSMLFLLILLGSVATAIIESNCFIFSFFTWLEYCFYILLVITMVNTIDNKKDTIRYINILIIIGTIFILIGLYRHFIVHKTCFINITNKIETKLETKNSLAFIYEALLLIILVRIIRNSIFSLKKIFLILISFLYLVVILLAESRGAWVSLSISTLAILFFNKKSIYYYLVYLIIFITLFLALPRLFSTKQIVSRAETLENISSPAKVSVSRFALLLSARDMVLTHPLTGVGLGCFGINVKKRKFWHGAFARHAHNAYLNFWAESGIFGLLALLYIIYVSLICAYRNMLYSDIKLRSINSGLFFVLIAWYTHFLFSVFCNILFFWIIIGIIFTNEKFRTEERERISYVKR